MIFGVIYSPQNHWIFRKLMTFESLGTNSALQMLLASILEQFGGAQAPFLGGFWLQKRQQFDNLLLNFIAKLDAMTFANVKQHDLVKNLR